MESSYSGGREDHRRAETVAGAGLESSYSRPDPGTTTGPTVAGAGLESSYSSSPVPTLWEATVAGAGLESSYSPRSPVLVSGARGLDHRDLDNAHAAGRLYADVRNNAVFLCTNAAGIVTGAEIVSRSFRGMARGSRKNSGGVHFQGPAAHPGTILIAESAIDALSARAVMATAPLSIYASTAGVCRSLPDWILDLKPERILCAFDSDDAGDDAARALIASDPRIRRLRPTAAKDWNDILRMTARAEQP